MWLDDHYGNPFCWICNNLKAFLGQLGCRLQKLIKNSYFIKTIKFQLHSLFLTFIFVWKKIGIFLQIATSHTPHSACHMHVYFSLQWAYSSQSAKIGWPLPKYFALGAKFNIETPELNPSRVHIAHPNELIQVIRRGSHSCSFQLLGEIFMMRMKCCSIKTGLGFQEDCNALNILFWHLMNQLRIFKTFHLG